MNILSGVTGLVELGEAIVQHDLVKPKSSTKFLGLIILEKFYFKHMVTLITSIVTHHNPF